MIPSLCQEEELEKIKQARLDACAEKKSKSKQISRNISGCMVYSVCGKPYKYVSLLGSNELGQALM